MALIEDFALPGLSRHKIREHVDRMIGLKKGIETEHARQRQGETRAERMQRLARDEGDGLPERIG